MRTTICRGYTPQLTQHIYIVQCAENPKSPRCRTNHHHHQLTLWESKDRIESTATFFIFVFIQFLLIWFCCDSNTKTRICLHHLTGFQLFNLQKDSPLQTLEPSTLQALYELVSLVHDSDEVVNQNDRPEPTSEGTSSNRRDETKIAAPDDSSLLDKDPVAKTILPVEPLELRSMMLAMVVCTISFCFISVIFPNSICEATLFCC